MIALAGWVLGVVGLFWAVIAWGLLTRVLGVLNWPGKVGYVVGQTIAGAGAGLLAGPVLHVAFGLIDVDKSGVGSGLLFTVLLSMAFGGGAAGWYGLLHEREALAEEFIRLDKHLALRRALRHRDPARAAELYLALREDDVTERAYLRAHPRLNVDASNRVAKSLQRDENALLTLASADRLPAAWRERLEAALERVRAEKAQPFSGPAA